MWTAADVHEVHPFVLGLFQEGMDPSGVTTLGGMVSKLGLIDT